MTLFFIEIPLQAMERAVENSICQSALMRRFQLQIGMISKGRMISMKTAHKTHDSGIVTGTNDYLVGRLFKGLLVVSIVMMLSATICMSIDSIVAGNFVGEDALAAMNVAMPLFVAVTMLSGILSNGGAALAARYLGQNKQDEVNSIFTLVMLLDVLVGLIIIVCVYPNMSGIASFLGAKDAGVNEMTVKYTIGILIGVLPIMLNSSLLYFIRVVGNPQLGIITTLVMSGVNIALDIILVGPLKMGMFGLAIATSAGYLAACTVSLVYLLRGKCSLRLVTPRKMFKNFAALINLGLPNALTGMVSVARGIVLNNLVALSLGTAVLNAMSAQGAVGNIVSCAALGVGFAVVPLVGIFFGEQDRLSICKTMKNGMKSGIILNAVLAILISVLAGPLAGMFNITDESTIRMVMRAVWIFALTMPFAMIGYTFICYYQNTKRVWLANTLIVSKVVFVIVFATLTIDVLGDNAIWLSGLFSEVMPIILNLIIVCAVNKKIPTSLEDLLLLPKDWNTDSPCYEVSLKNNLDDCVGLSENIRTFCTEHGAPKKVSYYSALCLEEMAANTIKYGFKGTADHFIDIKVILSGDTMKLRIRDDGMEFNPFGYLKKQDEDKEQNDSIETGENEFKNIGIRLVKELAKNVDYRYTMRLNNLFVEVVGDKTLKLAEARGNWEQAENFLQEALTAYKCPDKTINRVILAAEELYHIMAEHAYAPGDGEITIKVKPIEKGVSINIQDKGRPYDPTKTEEETGDITEGLGMRIVEKTMDIVAYTYQSGKNSTSVCKYW
jgi:Na+-driven multidrug efflux pump/anti-sigma regulatory factor (Ser/Thr protein kinase)